MTAKTKQLIEARKRANQSVIVTIDRRVQSGLILLMATIATYMALNQAGGWLYQLLNG